MKIYVFEFREMDQEGDVVTSIFCDLGVTHKHPIFVLT